MKKLNLIARLITLAIVYGKEEVRYILNCSLAL